MFLMNLTYSKPIEEVDRVLPAHRAYLAEQYEKKTLICSGPKTPREGGIILCAVTDREAVEAIMHQDPFYKEGIATYELIEFNPVKKLDAFAQLLSSLE